MRQSSQRHLGTYYYAGENPYGKGKILVSRPGGFVLYETCGHKHATVRRAMQCKRKFANPVIFMAHLGRLPAKVIG